ncbi:hypothetical protein HNE05_14440 [Aquipseudomonas campi]|uniref:Type 4 fimbrial biogenesis protein PilX N-terminal domain-containing protein n=1 Tax=Aquipseudomonas campi TaxID=2731681 RepID=A0A6M8FJE1_9GAMM|nr:PilX N-terminal domain-containing pilus assembly protein [Pseudomonas campi]QKE64492.1 hypothetical protein HNE05_14440 [Pseudomonas campi]
MKTLHRQNQQRGMVLVVSLTLLLLLTILAISASTSSSLQERMASNAQENNVAFQAAESALANLSSQVENGTTPVADSVLALTYPTRTVRARMQAASRYAEGSSLEAGEGSGTPIILIHDFTSSATLDASATTAAAITDDNTNARHLQGHRERIIQ